MSSMITSLGGRGKEKIIPFCIEYSHQKKHIPRYLHRYVQHLVHRYLQTTES